MMKASTLINKIAWFAAFCGMAVEQIWIAVHFKIIADFITCSFSFYSLAILFGLLRTFSLKTFSENSIKLYTDWEGILTSPLWTNKVKTTAEAISLYLIEQ